MPAALITHAFEVTYRSQDVLTFQISLSHNFERQSAGYIEFLILSNSQHILTLCLKTTLVNYNFEAIPFLIYTSLIRPILVLIIDFLNVATRPPREQRPAPQPTRARLSRRQRAYPQPVPPPQYGEMGDA